MFATHRPSASRRRRAGVSLLELLLVLALLVVVAAFVLPAFRGPLENQRLKKAADIVRTEWARTRVKAMRTGRVHVFRYQVSGGMSGTPFQSGSTWQVEPWLSGSDILEADLQTTVELNSPQAMEYVAAAATTSQLPDDIQFVATDSAYDSRSAEIEQASVAGSTGANFWSRPIVFYPDGTTSTSQVILGNSRGRFVMLNLRGVTGTTQASDLLSQDELPRS